MFIQKSAHFRAALTNFQAIGLLRFLCHIQYRPSWTMLLCQHVRSLILKVLKKIHLQTLILSVKNNVRRKRVLVDSNKQLN